jgi:hypothetical protein
MDGLAEVTAIETSGAGATVRVVAPLMVACAAVTVQAPCAIPFATPLPLTVATEGFDEDHVAEVVRSLLLPSL